MGFIVLLLGQGVVGALRKRVARSGFVRLRAADGMLLAVLVVAELGAARLEF